MQPIIPEDERSKEPLDTERIIYHPDMIKANDWVINEYEALTGYVFLFPAPRESLTMKARPIKNLTG